MGWSSGTFTRARDWTADEAAGETMDANLFDQEDDNFEAGINNCLTKDGQNTPTAGLPMDGNRHTGVGNANARDTYASAADVMDQDLIYYVDSGSADAYVITPSPAITAYEEGQKFVFRATNANTGASTLNVNSLGATAIQTNDGAVLAPGAIIAGGYYEVVYDANPGTDRFVLLSPSNVPQVQTLVKTADTARSSTITLADDPHLAGFVLEANAKYIINGFLFHTQPDDSTGLKVDWQTSQTLDGFTVTYSARGGATSTNFVSIPPSSSVLLPADTSAAAAAIHGFVDTGGSAPTIDMQWAQASSTADANTLHEGSWVQFIKIG